MKRASGERFDRDLQYYKFCAYGFLKDLRFFEPFLLLLFLDKGLSYLQVGSIYALREVMINIVEIPSGIMADAMGRRRTMILSFLAYIASFGLFYFSHTYQALLFAMGVFAFGDAFRTGTHKAMIFDYLKIKGWADQKTHYYGHTRSWSQRGAALSALIAAGLVFTSGSYAPVLGRLEIIRKDSKIWILDGAHNAAAAECLAETLREYWPDTKFTAVTGVFKDKEYSKIAAILSGVLNHAICIDLPEVGRSLPKEELAAVYEKVGVKSDVSDSIETAIKEATSDAVLVTGSLSLLRSAKDGIEKFYF